MLNRERIEAARAGLDAQAKPLSSLGAFEEVISKLAGIYGTPDVPAEIVTIEAE